MSCNSCTKVKLICCSNNIIIGTIPDETDTYYVIIEDVSNGRKLILPVLMIGQTMTIDVSDISFAENHSYELYLVSTSDITINLSWQINETNVDCLSIRFEKVFNENGEVLYMDNQFITL